MNASSLSFGSLSDLEDSSSGGNCAKPDYTPKDEFLSTLNSEFEKSKADLLGRFLVDQAELNRRFGESCDTDDSKDSTDDNSSENSLHETENLLRQKLAIHRQDFSSERCRTSMGFYNQAEFKTAEKETGCAGEKRPSVVAETGGFLNPRVSKNGLNSDSICLRTSFEKGKKTRHVPHASTRPKTSFGKKSLIKPQIMTRENEYSYQTVSSQKMQAEDWKDHRVVNVAFEDCRAGEVWSEQNQGDTGSNISKASCATSYARSRGIPSATHLRPVKRVPFINGKSSQIDAFRGINGVGDAGVPFLDARLQPETSPLSSDFQKRHRENLRSGSPVFLNRNISRDMSVSAGATGSSFASHKEGRVTSKQYSVTKSKNGCNMKSFRRHTPLTLVKLPPLDASVARRSSAHKNVTLNSACY